MVTADGFLFCLVPGVGAVVVVSFLITRSWLFFHTLPELYNGRMPEVEESLASYYTRHSGLQRRRERRSAVAPFLEVELFDGVETRAGRLTNISGHGIGIETGRDAVARSCSQIDVLVRSCNRQMRITAEPRWQRTVVPGVVALGCFVPGTMPDMFG